MVEEGATLVRPLSAPPEPIADAVVWRAVFDRYEGEWVYTYWRTPLPPEALEVE